ncbi:MAG: 2-hydroxyacyl-CoA dehydratase subunit D [Bacillota bacterium]
MNGTENSFKENQHINLLLEESALKGAQRSARYPGSRFFGYFCSYWPEELVLAAGMEPLRILPAAINATPAELPAFCCTLARGSLAMALKGQLSDLAGVGFAHTCDTMQCLGGIWEETTGREKTLIVVPPVMLNAPGAGRYYRKEFELLTKRLGELTGNSPGPGDLKRAIMLCDRVRQLVTELDQQRTMLPSHVVLAVMRAGQLMPREAYAAELELALPALREMACEPGNRQRLLVSGAVMESDSLFQMIEELGGRVVADDTCTGYRHYSGPLAEEGDDPLDSIVRRYTGIASCPCRNRGLQERMEYLERMARERSAGGAVLVIRKYCDPHAWDAVPVTERLRGLGMKTLVLELEGSEVGGQERTRLQAFLESI